MAISKTFTKRRSLNMAANVAQVIRLEFEAGRISTLFGLEGVIRAALRSNLCLRGWQWEDAQRAAKDITGAAHSLLGAKRRDWIEGQPEYIVAEGLLIQRTRCKRCHKDLPDGHRKYCSDLCCNNDHRALSYRKAANGDRAADLAVRATRKAQE